MADACGSRADAVVRELKRVRKPCGLEPFYPEGAGVYERPLPAAAHPMGKASPQQSERKQLPWRTQSKRLARKPSWFSTSVFLHDTVIGLFGNRYEFGTPISLHPINNLRTRPQLFSNPGRKEASRGETDAAAHGKRRG